MTPPSRYSVVDVTPRLALPLGEFVQRWHRRNAALATVVDRRLIAMLFGCRSMVRPSASA